MVSIVLYASLSGKGGGRSMCVLDHIFFVVLLLCANAQPFRVCWLMVVVVMVVGVVVVEITIPQHFVLCQYRYFGICFRPLFDNG